MNRRNIHVLYFIILASFAFLLLYFFRAKDTVAIIGAMDDEINEIYNSLNCPKTIKYNDYVITTGKLGKNNIVLSKSGVGKVASATTTQFIIDKYKPVFIINTGIAGSISTNLKSGSIIIGEKMVQHDFDVTAFGSPKGYIDNGIEPNKPTIFYSDKKIVEKLKKRLELYKNENIIFCTIATGDIFVNKEEQKKEIKEEFEADAIDMESAAIAQTAQRNSVPLIVIRTISDSENNSTSEYKNNKKSSAKKSAQMIQSIFTGNILRKRDF